MNWLQKLNNLKLISVSETQTVNIFVSDSRRFIRSLKRAETQNFVTVFMSKYIPSSRIPQYQKGILKLIGSSTASVYAQMGSSKMCASDAG